MPTVESVVAAMETIAPPHLALPDDRPRIGLHAGSRRARVRAVALSLDASLDAVAAARQWGADMLVVHHPRFYRGLRTLDEADPSGRRAAAILHAGLAVYSAHTNLDVAPGGTNDLLADAADLRDRSILQPTHTGRILKLAVFVPRTHADRVRRALDKAGAGAIGNYSGCTFRSPGVGTFRCGPGTSPFQGAPGSFEEAEEYRLETVFEEEARDAVLAAMLRAHPYEEAAYDIYTLDNPGRVSGLGRAGRLPGAERLDALAARLAAATGSTMVQHSGRPGHTVRTAAVWAGAGAPVEAIVRRGGVDAVITGELGYHEVETLRDSGVEAVTLGHGFSEQMVLGMAAKRLRALLPGVRTKILRQGYLAMTNAPCDARKKSGKK